MALAPVRHAVEAAGFFPPSISGGFRFAHPLDWRALGFTLALSLSSVILFGSAPALQTSQPELLRARHSRLQKTAMVVQVARVRPASLQLRAFYFFFVSAFSGGIS
jgi:hypothetical protein